MTQEGFFAQFTERLAELRPCQQFAAPEPNTDLWASGYLDSLAMLEIVTLLEDVVGREIELDGDFLSRFTTMESIYEAYVAPVRA